MTKRALVVDNLSKRYQIGQCAGYRTLRESMHDTLRARWWHDRVKNGSDSDSILALRGVSFEVSPGEVVGIIGRNGAGKSTLLKVLSRTTEPSSCRAIIKGRVASLLGWHRLSPRITQLLSYFMTRPNHERQVEE